MQQAIRRHIYIYIIGDWGSSAKNVRHITLAYETYMGHMTYKGH